MANHGDVGVLLKIIEEAKLSKKHEEMLAQMEIGGFYGKKEPEMRPPYGPGDEVHRGLPGRQLLGEAGEPGPGYGGTPGVACPGLGPAPGADCGQAPRDDGHSGPGAKAPRGGQAPQTSGGFSAGLDEAPVI